MRKLLLDYFVRSKKNRERAGFEPSTLGTVNISMRYDALTNSATTAKSTSFGQNPKDSDPKDIDKGI